MTAMMDATKSGTADAATDQSVYFAVMQFLGREARLLDECRFEEWFALLDPEISYEIPIRLAVTRNSPNQFLKDSYRVRDDWAMIRKRVDRSSTGEDWSEAPPSRTLRSVSSVEIEGTDRADVYRVHSALIVYRERAVEEHWDLLPARRIDLVRVANGGCTLLERKVILTERSVRTPNLGIFL